MFRSSLAYELRADHVRVWMGALRTMADAPAWSTVAGDPLEALLPEIARRLENGSLALLEEPPVRGGGASRNAQRAPSQPPARAEPPGAIEGVVREEGTNTVLPDASVELRERGMVTTTDAHGHYRFADVTPGRYTLHASRAPREDPSSHSMIGHALREAHVSVGSRQTAHANFTLRPIGLQLVDAAGRVLSDGQVKTTTIGERTTLQARSIPAGLTLTQIQWTVPGWRVGGWSEDLLGSSDEIAHSPAVVTLTADDLAQPRIAFHWVRAPSGSNPSTVQFRAVIEGVAFSIEKRFRVFEPVVRIVATTSTVSVGPHPHDRLNAQHGRHLVFGNATARGGVPFAGAMNPTDVLHGVPGIEIQAVYELPAEVSAGDIAACQTILPNYWSLNDARRQRAVSTSWMIDGAGQASLSSPFSALYPSIQAGITRRYHYVQSGGRIEVGVTDSPSVRVHDEQVEARMDLRLKTYFLFKPSTEGAIYCPLRVVSWGVRGQMQHREIHGRGCAAGFIPPYVVDPGSVSVPTPQVMDAQEFPEWQANVDIFFDTAWRE